MKSKTGQIRLGGPAWIVKSCAIALLSAAFLLAVMGVISQPAFAQQEITQEELDELLRVKRRTVRHLAFSPVLIRATRRQNSTGLTLDEIKRRDTEWKGTKDLTPFKLELQNNNAGKMLKRFVERNASFNEAFLTDNQGANVAAYPATSDYWQGDEEKWSESYQNGNGQMFIGGIELDESTNTYATQISAPVMDRDQTIGVLVVGVTFNYVRSRQ